MTRDQVKEVLDRVLTWPRERQQDVVKMLSTMAEQDKSDYRLTPEQASEVRRRLRQKHAKTVSLSMFNKNIRRRYGI